MDACKNDIVNTLECDSPDYKPKKCNVNVCMYDEGIVGIARKDEL